jgi:hypothetical protein
MLNQARLFERAVRAVAVHQAVEAVRTESVDYAVCEFLQTRRAGPGSVEVSFGVDRAQVAPAPGELNVLKLVEIEIAAVQAIERASEQLASLTVDSECDQTGDRV